MSEYLDVHDPWRCQFRADKSMKRRNGRRAGEEGGHPDIENQNTRNVHENCEIKMLLKFTAYRKYRLHVGIRIGCQKRPYKSNS